MPSYLEREIEKYNSWSVCYEDKISNASLFRASENSSLDFERDMATKADVSERADNRGERDRRERSRKRVSWTNEKNEIESDIALMIQIAGSCYDDIPAESIAARNSSGSR